MFESRLRKMLKADEEVIQIVRKYPLVFFWPTCISVIFIIASFFFLYPLFKAGTMGVIGFFALLSIGILLAVRTLVVYSFNTFIITQRRIIDVDQRGFFERIVSETTYDKIQDVSIRIKGVMQTLLHYGSVIIQTAGTQANIELHGVKNPEYIQQTITEIQREFKENNLPSASATAEAIEKIKHMTSDKQVTSEDD